MRDAIFPTRERENGLFQRKSLDKRRFPFLAWEKVLARTFCAMAGGLAAPPLPLPICGKSEEEDDVDDDDEGVLMSLQR